MGEGEDVGRLAYTIFTLKVDEVIKDDPDIKEVLIRTSGEPIEEGSIYQVPVGPSFNLSDWTLVGLKKTKRQYVHHYGNILG